MQTKNISLPEKLTEKLEERSNKLDISEAEIVRNALIDRFEV